RSGQRSRGRFQSLQAGTRTGRSGSRGRLCRAGIVVGRAIGRRRRFGCLRGCGRRASAIGRYHLFCADHPLWTKAHVTFRHGPFRLAEDRLEKPSTVVLTLEQLRLVLASAHGEGRGAGERDCEKNAMTWQNCCPRSFISSLNSYFASSPWHTARRWHTASSLRQRITAVGHWPSCIG